MNKYLLSVFVRLFLEKKEKALMKFISEFQKLTVSDEKVSRLQSISSLAVHHGNGTRP